MAVDAVLVNAANRGMTLAQATTALSTFGTIAAEIVANDISGLSSALSDWCTALMICHLWAGGDEKAGMRSFTTGDFSGSQDPGKTIWMIQYQQILADFRIDNVAEAHDVRRCDSIMDDFKLDQSDDPVIFTDVNSEV